MYVVELDEVDVCGSVVVSGNRGWDLAGPCSTPDRYLFSWVLLWTEM